MIICKEICKRNSSFLFIPLKLRGLPRAKSNENAWTTDFLTYFQAAAHQLQGLFLVLWFTVHLLLCWVFLCVVHITETAQSHGGRGIKDAVLAVPNDFTAEQRNAAR